MELRERFSEIVTTEEQVRAILGSPTPTALKKELTYLNEQQQAFIKRSSFVLISSCDAEGRMDISPKGDPTGFVKILDQRTLAIPDRPGNRRADTLKNLLTNDRVGLLFIVLGKRETLRVSGTAAIVRDRDLRESLAVNGKAPELAIVVAVEGAFSHCPKCMIRSDFWNPAAWPTQEGLPSHAEALHTASGVDMPLSQLEEFVQKDIKERLY